MPLVILKVSSRAHLELTPQNSAGAVPMSTDTQVVQLFLSPDTTSLSLKSSAVFLIVQILNTKAYYCSYSNPHCGCKILCQTIPITCTVSSHKILSRVDKADASSIEVCLMRGQSQTYQREMFIP